MSLECFLPQDMLQKKLMNSPSKEFRTCKPVCLNGEKNVHRRGAAEDTERFVKESEEALTSDDVKILENSKHACQVHKEYCGDGRC